MGRNLIPGIDKIKEDWVKKEVKRILKEFKERYKVSEMYWWMPQASMYGESGQHDFSIVLRGLYWSIETKAGKNIPTENQIRFATEISSAGGISLCVNEFNLNEVSDVLSVMQEIRRIPDWMGHDFTKYRKL